ncbi:MAG: hypothetical protein ACUVTL_08495 [Thermoproteota archaeon]
MRRSIGIAFGALFGVVLVFFPKIIGLIGLSNNVISREAEVLVVKKSENTDGLESFLTVAQPAAFTIGAGSVAALGAYLLAKRLRHCSY